MKSKSRTVCCILISRHNAIIQWYFESSLEHQDPQNPQEQRPTLVVQARAHLTLHQSRLTSVVADKHVQCYSGCTTFVEHATIRSSTNCDGILYTECIPTWRNTSYSILLHGTTLCTIWIYLKLQFCAITADGTLKRSHKHMCTAGDA